MKTIPTVFCVSCVTWQSYGASITQIVVKLSISIKYLLKGWIDLTQSLHITQTGYLNMIILINGHRTIRHPMQ